MRAAIHDQRLSSVRARRTSPPPPPRSLFPVCLSRTPRNSYAAYGATPTGERAGERDGRRRASEERATMNSCSVHRTPTVLLLCLPSPILLLAACCSPHGAVGAATVPLSLSSASLLLLGFVRANVPRKTRRRNCLPLFSSRSSYMFLHCSSTSSPLFLSVCVDVYIM